ncbi:Rieske (2Fe-2S) protein [Kribbella turkmenica]|uniref:Rieske (2Fe-2S) protein n=1 Tax=Kribbella turkmenica TaxID=2530375 RepID=UPI001F1C426E|nr:Rieske (2Fe-2S) protein [Kribbella turkmenica]
MDEASRRTVLAAGAAAVAAVSGCSTYGEPQNAPATSAPANAVLAKTADVPVGGGVIVGDAQVVVTQPTAGTFKAFTSVCTHQRCQVASVEGGTINCTCHGSKFDITDGSVVKDPAQQPLAPQRITVTGDSIRLG